MMTKKMSTKIENCITQDMGSCVKAWAYSEIFFLLFWSTLGHDGSDKLGIL